MCGQFSDSLCLRFLNHVAKIRHQLRAIRRSMSMNVEVSCDLKMRFLIPRRCASLAVKEAHHWHLTMRFMRVHTSTSSMEYAGSPRYSSISVTSRMVRICLLSNLLPLAVKSSYSSVQRLISLVRRRTAFCGSHLGNTSSPRCGEYKLLLTSYTLLY